MAAQSRYGVAQQRLIVYPPGISKRDRRWLRVWRGWSVWSGLLWFVLQVFFANVIGPWQAFASSAGVSVAAGAVAFAMAGHSRCQVRTYNTCILAGCGGAEILFGQRKFRLLTTLLVTADAQYRRGELTVVAYEQIWWQVYDAIAPSSDALPADEPHSPRS